mgnify:CR=1 FL=1
MTGTQILDKFNLQVDDSSELSDTEALDLANDVYQEIQDDRPWEWLKKSFAGNTSASVPYIALPSDFKEVVPQYSGLQNGSFNNLGVPAGYRAPVYTSPTNQAVVFVGTTYSPYRIISYQDRRNYRDQDGFAYVDVPNARLVFTKQSTSVQTVEYDYVSIATAIAAGTSPLFRAGFHKIIAYGMAAKYANIEQASDKGSSYQKENQELYNDVLMAMAEEDANIKLAYS